MNAATDNVDAGSHGTAWANTLRSSSGPTPADLVVAAQRIGIDLARLASQRDAEADLRLDAFARIRANRIGGARVPCEFGGAGARIDHVVRIAIALAQGDPAVAQAMLPHFVFVERTLLMATPAQSRHFLSQVAQGAIVGGASAERGGKFRGEMQTLLSRAGGDREYRLNGVKHYCTGALYGDLLKVLALDEEGKTVLAVLPVERAGIVRHNDWDGMGQRATASGTTELNDVVVYEDEVMRVHSWQAQRHHTGAASQIIHCAIEVGIALAALRDATAFARKGARPVKESGVERAQDDPYVLHVVGNMAAHAHAAEAIVLRAAQTIELASQARFGGAPVAEIERLAVEASIATAEAKIISTEASLHVTQLMFEVGGGATTSRRLNFDRHWRNARTHTTHDPVSYKYRAVGNFHLNDAPPPLSYSY